jgi:hypothetical protein
MPDYALVFNPVSSRAHYLRVEDVALTGGGVDMLARLIWSSAGDLRSGYDIARLRLEKWYNIHVKIARELFGMRWLAERLAPAYIVRLELPSSAVSVELDGAALTVYLGDLTRAQGEERVLRMVSLFKEPSKLKEFLDMQSVFADSLVEVYAKLDTRVEEYTRVFAKVIDAVNNILKDVVERLPGAYEVIEDVLSKYNVTGKAVVDFAVQEAVAKLVVAELQRRLAELAPPQKPAPAAPATTATAPR